LGSRRCRLSSGMSKIGDGLHYVRLSSAKARELLSDENEFLL
jgi:hypothetical protein